MRRDKSEVDSKSDIDEFIHLAQRWNTLHKRLLNTLARLPEEVYQFTIKNISFHAGQSQTIQVDEINKRYMIILKRTDSESLIAHEIAHAYLNYNKTKNKSTDQETEAEELRKKWGFKKKQLCQTFPKGCLNCFNPHCSESKTRRPR
jgi:meiotically up-regulated gene 157 (Mug157) protein